MRGLRKTFAFACETVRYVFKGRKRGRGRERNALRPRERLHEIEQASAGFGVRRRRFDELVDGQRATLTNMSVEAGGTTIIEPDEATLATL
jgi:hypothetical protein